MTDEDGAALEPLVRTELHAKDAYESVQRNKSVNAVSRVRLKIEWEVACREVEQKRKVLGLSGS